MNIDFMLRFNVVMRAEKQENFQLLCTNILFPHSY